MSIVDMLMNKAMNSPKVQSNPMAQNALRMYQNHDAQGLQQMANNLCKQNGTTVEEVRRKLGI